MKSVIIVGPRISQAESVTRAFSELGWASTLFNFQLKTPGPFARVAYRIHPRVKEAMLRKEYNECFKKEVLPALQAQTPTLVLVFRGSRLTRSNRATLAAQSPRLAVWVIDSLSRFPAQDCLRSITKNAFYLDGGDAIKRGGAWLPMGYEKELYGDLSSVEKTIDVLFIGYVRAARYATRRKTLLMLGASTVPKRWRCVFAGTTGTVRGDRAIGQITGIECLGRVSAREYASRIASARVCVNVHQDDGVMPINSAFFQIPAADTCQLAEDRRYLSDWLEPGKDYIEFQRQDFVPTLEDLLKNPTRCKDVAATGRRKVEKHHSFTHRVQYLLEAVGRRS